MQNNITPLKAMEPHDKAMYLPGHSPEQMPLLAHLIVLCLLFPAFAAVSCGAADPFLPDTELSTTIFLPDVLAMSEHPTKAAASDIERLDIFVFNDDGARRLDSYCSKGKPATPYIDVSSSAGAAGYTSVKLAPLISGVCLDFLKCDFSGRGYRSRTLENCSVYLTNVSGSCEILRQDGFRV